MTVKTAKLKIRLTHRNELVKIIMKILKFVNENYAS